MAIASAKPRPIRSGTRMGPMTSGLRPMASMALPTPYPTPIPGPIAPRPMARAGAHTFGAAVAAAAWAKKPSSVNTREPPKRIRTVDHARQQPARFLLIHALHAAHAHLRER